MKRYILCILSVILVLSMIMFAGCNNSDNKPDNNSDNQTIVDDDEGFCKHDYEVIETSPATCTKPTEKTFRCKKCGKTYTETEGDPLGHTGEWVLTEKPTCTKEGKETRTCTRCQHVDERPVPPTEHDYVEIVEERVESDCTHNGKKVFKCKNEGCEEKYEQIIFAKGHEKSDNGILHAPTCTEEGYTEYTCSVCGEKFKDSFLPATGHDFVESETFEATCEHGSGKKFVCSHCGEEKYEYTGKRNPHQFDENGICVHCNKNIMDLVPVTLSENCYSLAKEQQKDKGWVFLYSEGEMNNAPKFDFIIEKDFVNGFIKKGSNGATVIFDRKTNDHATNITVNNMSENKAVYVFLPFTENTDAIIHDVAISNIPSWVASSDGWLPADGFRIKINLQYEYNFDVPESYIESEAPYSYISDENLFLTEYTGNYPNNCKLIIRKQYIDDIVSQGKTHLIIRVTGGGKPGIDKDDELGTVLGMRSAGLAEYSLDIINKDPEIFRDGNVVVRIYSNMSAQLKVSLSPYVEVKENNYIISDGNYMFDTEQGCYTGTYTNRYPNECIFKVKKEYLDKLRNEGYDSLKIKVIGDGRPGIDKDDAAGTVCGTRTPASDGKPGVAENTFDITKDDQTLFVNGDLVLRIYTTLLTDLNVYFEPIKG